MTDPDSTQPAVPATGDVSPAPDAKPRKSFKRRHWGKLTLLAVVGVPTVVLVGWSYAALAYTYSSGTRVGYMQKLSRKGWLCKTWEGELQMAALPGTAPVVFNFTVRNDSLAKVLEGAMSGRVELQYDEHPGIPLLCFGETEYFLSGVKSLR